MSTETPTTPTQSTTATTKPGKSFIPLIDKIKMVETAWGTLSPESKFGGMGKAEFTTTVAPYVDGCSWVEEGKRARAALVIQKNNADAATAKVVNAVVAGIKAAPEAGPDSGLYRACGYVTASERSAPTPKVAGATPTKRPSISLIDRVKLISNAWTAAGVDANAVFGGKTLAQFKAAVADSLNLRDQLDAAAAQQAAVVGDRDAQEKVVRNLISRVIGGVIADPDHGKSSPLYGAMGYKVTIR